MKTPQHLLKEVSFFVIFLFIPLINQAQCPLSFTCEASEVICQIDDLDGFRCRNQFSLSSSFPLSSLCNGTGVPRNTTWFSFIGTGDDLQITFLVDTMNCENKSGIQVGIFERFCDGRTVWDCTSNCITDSFTLSGTTKKWETYYVWVNGCFDDVCEFEVSVDGLFDRPDFPSSIDSFLIGGEFCAGGKIKLCHVQFDQECSPQYLWFIDDEWIEDSTENCITLSFDESTPVGKIFKLELMVGLGNRLHPDQFCDSAIVTIFTPPFPPVEQRMGPCKLVCFEDQPYICPNGGTRTSTGCSLRIKPVGKNCFVDSIYPVVLLPHPGMGRKDTFICMPGVPYTAENGKTFTGEVCNEVITFQKEFTSPMCPGASVMCDTSYFLNIGRFRYTKNWEVECSFCLGKVSLCANIRYITQCPIFAGTVDIELDWIDGNGNPLGTTRGNGCITIPTSGNYCVNIKGKYRNKTCIAPAAECFFVPPSYFGDNTPIIQDTVHCKDSVAVYSIDPKSIYCEYQWKINKGDGTILTPNFRDSSKIRVHWNTYSPDTNEICLTVRTDCYFKNVCLSTVICPKTTSNSGYTEGSIFYSNETNSLLSKGGFNNNETLITIYNSNGIMVLNQSVMGSEFRYSLPGLNPGLYIATIVTNGNKTVKTLKFIVIR